MESCDVLGLLPLFEMRMAWDHG